MTVRAQTRSWSSLAVVVVAVAWLTVPAVAEAGPYGIGDPNLDAQCARGGPCPAAGWLRPLLRGGGGFSYVHTGFPYDAVATADPAGNCLLAPSDQYANPNPDRDGQPYWRSLQAWLAAAYSLGLKPVVVLTPAMAPVDAAYENPGTDSSGTRRFACGVYYLLRLAASWGTPIHYLEAWNEPNLTGYGGDPAGAAHLFDVAHDQAAAFAAADPGQGPVDVAAGTLSSMTSQLCGGAARCPDTAGWLSTYIDHLSYQPIAWSFHDYSDITSAGAESTDVYTANLDAFTAILAAHYGAAYDAPIWLTEAAAQLQGGNYREPDARVPDCDNGEAGDDLLANGHWRISACLDQANPAGRVRQGWSARAWLELPVHNRRVTQIDWHEPDETAYTGWDSALLDPASRPRSSYCVIAYGEDPAAAADDSRCPGNPLDVGDAPDLNALIG